MDAYLVSCGVVIRSGGEIELKESPRVTSGRFENGR